MVVASVAIDKDHTVCLYCERDQTPKVDAMFAQRTWVGLTDEQIDNATRKQVNALLDHIYEFGTAAEGIDFRVRSIARAIEAAHGIKGDA